MILQGRIAMLALMRPDGSRLIPARAAAGLTTEQCEAIDVERLRQFSQFALTAGVPTTLNTQTECVGALGEPIGGLMRNCLCVPLLAHAPRAGEVTTVDPIVGLLMLCNKSSGDGFTDEDRTLAIILGKQLAAVLFEQQRREPIL